MVIPSTCYRNGNGVENYKKIAIEWVKITESVIIENNDFFDVIFFLVISRNYEKRIGTDVNEKEFFSDYKKAYDEGKIEGLSGNGQMF